MQNLLLKGNKLKLTEKLKIPFSLFFTLKISLFQKSYQQFAFLHSIALLIGVSFAFSLFSKIPFPTGVLAGWEEKKYILPKFKPTPKIIPNFALTNPHPMKCPNDTNKTDGLQKL